MAKYWEHLEYHEDKTEKHEITEQEIRFLMELQKEMNTQDHLIQADPRYWVIRDFDRIYGKELNNPDGCVYYLDSEELYSVNYAVLGSDAIIIDAAKDYFMEHYKEDFVTGDFDDLYDADSLEEMLEEHGYDITVVEYETIPKYSGMFLTQKAAEEHLRANYYHYSDDATTYAMTAWRSKEADMLYQILQEVDFSKIKSSEKLGGKCAWCKVDVEKQNRFEADDLSDGKCDECGSWNDIGQKKIKLNSMKQTYQGCIKLMQYVAESCADILNSADVDIRKIKESLDIDVDEPLSIAVGTWQIVKMLFLMHGSSGGTSTSNLTHLLGLKEDYVSLLLEEDERCVNQECKYYKEDKVCESREECAGYEMTADI